MKDVIKHLRDLGQDKIDPENISEGVCYELKNKFGPDLIDDVIFFSKKWSKYSGNTLFPMPCPMGGDPKLRYLNTKDHWSRSYGQLRREFCLFLAEQLEKLYT